MKKCWKKFLAMAVSASIALAATACGDAPRNIPDGEELQEMMDEAESKKEEEYQAQVEGSKDGMMRISSSEDLVKFKERVENGEIALGAVLTADIDMSDICGESIGSWEPVRQYAGTFDGDNHSIKNLYMNNMDGFTGLFGEALEGSVIKNVTMENYQIISAGEAGSLAGISYGTVENCHSNGQLTATGRISGGLCGIAEIMVGCSNRGTVNGVGATVGGVAGEVRGTMEKCWNEGTVESTGEYAGGVAGSLAKGNKSSLLQVFATDCYNTGKVTNEAYGAGGVAGYANNFVINRCYNLGEVSGLVDAGGIVATGTSVRGADAKPVIENCYNEGAISAINWTGTFKYGKKIVQSQNAAGIAAWMGGCIANCYNRGELSVSAGDQYGGSVAGIGDAIIVANSYAYGSLTAAEDSMKSGIGGLSSEAVISSFYLEGTVNDEPGSPEVFFTDGSLLSRLQSFSTDSVEDEAYHLELSGWVQGADGMPCFDWE